MEAPVRIAEQICLLSARIFGTLAMGEAFDGGGGLIYLVIGLFAAGGALLRWGVVEKMTLLGWWPWGTLLVNVLGSFLVGGIYVLASELHLLSPFWRDGLMIGLCGALTTFSSFSLDIFRLMEDQLWGPAILVILLNNSLAVAACALAIWALRA